MDVLGIIIGGGATEAAVEFVACGLHDILVGNVEAIVQRDVVSSESRPVVHRDRVVHFDVGDARVHIRRTCALQITENSIHISRGREVGIQIVEHSGHVGVPSHAEIYIHVIRYIGAVRVRLPAGVGHVVGLNADLHLSVVGQARQAHVRFVRAGTLLRIRLGRARTPAFIAGAGEGADVAARLAEDLRVINWTALAGIVPETHKMQAVLEGLIVGSDASHYEI